MTDQNDTTPQDDVPASVKLWALLFGLFALGSIAVAHVFYWYWRNDVGTCSDKNPFGEDKWGQYGDFIGGVTNPIISLLTFGGLLYTILVQRQEMALQRRELANSSRALTATEEELRQTKNIAATQAEFMRNESKKSDIEKALIQISKALDETLEYRPNIGMPTIEKDLLKNTEIHVTFFLKLHHNESYYSSEINKIINMLDKVAELSRHYEKLEPNSALITYYAFKYITVVGSILDATHDTEGRFNDLRTFHALGHL